LNVSLPQSLVATSEPADHSTHRSAGGSTLTRVAGYRAADCTQRRATAGALEHVRLRRLVRLSGLDVRGLWSAWIKPSLLHRPGVAFISVFVLLRLALPLDG